MKKFLSLALTLAMLCSVMSLAASPVFAADEGVIKFDGTVIIEKGTPTVDGVLAADEWGAPDAVIDFTSVGGPAKIEYWFSYDYDYLYAAMLVHDATVEQGEDFKTSSYFVPRLNMSLDENMGNDFIGLATILADGSLFCDAVLAGDNAQIAVTPTDGAAVMEFAIKTTALGAIKPVEGATFNGRMEYIDYVDGKTQFNRADFDFVIGSGVTYIENGAAIKADGTITADEWGTPDFVMDRDFTVNETTKVRRYVKNQYTGAPTPVSEYYWRYDDNNLYLAVMYDYGGDGDEGYAAWDYEDVYDPDTFKCVISLQYASHTAKVNLAMGNYSATIEQASLTKGQENDVNGVTAGFTDNGGIACYEFIIPLSKVGAADSFKGFIELEDRLAARQIAGEGEEPALYNGQQLFKDGIRELGGMYLGIRTTAINADSSRTHDTFFLKAPAAEEPVEPEQPAETEPAETEPAETEPAETEPAETEPAETEPAETEPAETEPAETEPAETEPAETEPAETEPAETEPAETEPAETEPAETEPEETEPAETEPAASETEPVEPEEPAETPEEPAETTGDPAPAEEKSNTGVIVGVAAAVVVIAIIAGVVIAKKKKK